MPDRSRSFAVAAALLLAAVTAGCAEGDPEPPVSSPNGAASDVTPTAAGTAEPSRANTPPEGETDQLDAAAADRQLTHAIEAMKGLPAVTISVNHDQGSWELPLPMLTDIYWMPETGDFHVSSRADNPAADAIFEYLHVDERTYARFRMIAKPATKWSDVTETSDADEGEPAPEQQWITGLAEFEPVDAEQVGASIRIRGTLPSATAITLLGTDFAGSLPEEAYEGTTRATIELEEGLPRSLRFSGDDVDLAKVDTASMIDGVLDGLRAVHYRAEYAEGDPADSPTRPAPDEVRRVSAFS